MSIEISNINSNQQNKQEVIINNEDDKNISEEVTADEFFDITKKAIEKLQTQKDQILGFNNITSEDRLILQEVDKQITLLQNEQINNFESKKQKLFKIIDNMEGVYSESQGEYSTEKIKTIIEDVLASKKEINHVPRSVIYKSTQNLREQITYLLELQEKYLQQEKEIVH